MLRKFFILSFLSFMLLQSFTANDDQRIKFKDYAWNDIGRAAKSQNKMIFVLVTGNYCTASRKMKRSLTEGKNKAGKFFNDNFVSTNFDAEDFVQHYRASNWGISTVPAMVFLDKNRHVVHKYQGFRTTDQMVYEAQIALSKK
ncbi:MAG: hypothetical protein EOP53_02840 [Sphingobacteriales bacterium]|nr:MAG: hypothetical protein EOP53_02840 [Sphingobacteriales bacterium]